MYFTELLPYQPEQELPDNLTIRDAHDLDGPFVTTPRWNILRVVTKSKRPANVDSIPERPSRNATLAALDDAA